MQTDVEMPDAALLAPSSPPTSATGTGSRPESPIAVDPDVDHDDDDSDDSDDDDDAVSALDTTTPSVVVTDASAPAPNGAAPHAPSPPPSGTSAAPSTGVKPPSAASLPPPPALAPKPKSKARPRSPSPSPPPAPPPPPPMRTVRLDIVLGGPEKYEVDVRGLLKATGQRPPTPPPAAKRYESESEGEAEGEPEEGKEEGKAKRRKKKHLGAEYYDITDPFIDDSELAVDERTYFAQTKQQGFYVSSGEVALLKDKTPTKKPKSRRPNLPPPEPIAGPSNFPHLHGHMHTHAQLGAKKDKDKKSEEKKEARDVPITLLEDVEEELGAKRKSVGGADTDAGSVSSLSKKKRKLVDIHPFHPELEAAIEELRTAIAKENWDVKGKFPAGIKPLLAQVAVKAIRLNEYDDNFFNLMPRLFPYNRFTMSKLIKRTVFHEHTALLTQRQDELLVELKRLAEEGFARTQEEWEKSVSAWEKKQEKMKTEGGTPSLEDTPSAQPPPDADTSAMDVDGAGEGEREADKDGAEGGGKGKEAHPPQKKYRLTEAMKGIMWNLVCLSNECCRIENEKNFLEGSTTQVSEQGLRKILYQKIVASFPDGWMSSGQISREVSVMKKKFEKEALENES